MMRTATTNELPAAAREKLTALRRMVEDSEAIFRATTAKCEAMTSEINRSPEEADAIRTLLAEERALQARRAERRNADATILNRVEDFCRKATSFAPYVEKVVVGTMTLERVRAQIRKIKNELLAVEAEQPRASDVARRAEEILRDMGEPTLEPDGWLRFPRIPEHSQRKTEDAYALRILATVSPEATRVLIRRLAERDYPAEGTPDADRRLKRRELSEALLDAERVEEALVMAALAEGADVQRRPGASPVAILGLQGATLAPSIATLIKRTA